MNETERGRRVTKDELEEWLADHGLLIRNVSEVRFTVASTRGKEVYAEVDVFVRDRGGQFFFKTGINGGVREIATERRLVPIRWLPGRSPEPRS